MKTLINKIAVCGLLSSTLLACSTVDSMQADSVSAANSQMTELTNTAADTKTSITDKIRGLISSETAPINEVNNDLQALKAQLEVQQQRLETMNQEQQALQEQLKRQSVTLRVRPTASANAGRTTVGTASTAYVAFLEDESQFADLEELAVKEINVIPKRETAVSLNIAPEAKFIAIKVGLRYTKKRSQILIPLSSVDFDSDLVLNIGACDVNIESGIDPKLAAAFTAKLNYYQQPLVSCS